MRKQEGESGPGRRQGNRSVKGEPCKGRQARVSCEGGGAKQGGEEGALESRQPLCLFVFSIRAGPALPLLGGPVQKLNQAVMGGLCLTSLPAGSWQMEEEGNEGDPSVLLVWTTLLGSS